VEGDWGGEGEVEGSPGGEQEAGEEGAASRILKVVGSGRNYATLHNIKQLKKCKEAGVNKNRVGTGSMNFNPPALPPPLPPTFHSSLDNIPQFLGKKHRILKCNVFVTKRYLRHRLGHCCVTS